MLHSVHQAGVYCGAEVARGGVGAIVDSGNERVRIGRSSGRVRIIRINQSGPDPKAIRNVCRVSGGRTEKRIINVLKEIQGGEVAGKRRNS